MTTTTCSIAQYLDIVKFEKQLKNDAALCRALLLRPPVISKLRAGKIPLTPMIMLRLHERLDMSISEMRQLVHAHEFSMEARAGYIDQVQETAEA